MTSAPSVGGRAVCKGLRPRVVLGWVDCPGPYGGPERDGFSYERGTPECSTVRAVSLGEHGWTQHSACVKSLRSSYTGLYPQKHGWRATQEHALHQRS